MRKSIIFLICLFSGLVTIAQQSINYKAIIKDNSGVILANTQITVDFTIFEGAGLSTIAYGETHTPTTNDDGIIILNIGEGTVTTGVFSNIDWGADEHFLNTQIDIGAGFIDMGTTEFQAVPYALHAANTFSGNYNDLTNAPAIPKGAAGLDTIDEGKGTGYRLLGRDTANYGAIGEGAIDLSWSTGSGNAGALGKNALAIGENTKAPSRNEMVVGAFNTDYSPTDSVNWNVTDRLFVIGNGANSSAQSDALIVQKDGSITAPSLELQKIVDDKSLITKEYADTNYKNNVLEMVDEGNGIGYRLADRDTGYYGAVGEGAIDLSWSTNPGSAGALGKNAMAIGENTTAFSRNEMVTGAFNTDYTPLDSVNWNATDRLFVIGNGLDSATKSDALLVLKDGSISAPSLELQKIVDGKSLITKEYADTNYSNTGLERLDEGNGFGFRIAGRNPVDYGSIGAEAVDLSYSNSSSSTKGATGARAFAVGYNAEASGIHTIAMGFGARATDSYTIAIGNNAYANFIGAVSLGNNAYATGAHSVAVGSNSDALGSNSIALGVNTGANAYRAMAAGSNCQADGDYSNALGNFITAKSCSETVMGRYNTIYSPSSTSTWVATDRLFVIGNGSNSSGRSDAIVVLKNGNTGLGTSTPVNRLDVAGGLAIGAAYAGTNTAPSDGLIVEGDVGIGTNAPIYPLQVTTRNLGVGDATPNHYLANAGVGINGTGWTYSIAATYGIWSGVGFSTSSDRRIKDIIGQSNSSKDLDLLMDIEVTDYRFIDRVNNTNTITKKVIAQQVKEVLPNAISYTTDVIPNVYQMADVEAGESDTAELHLPQNTDVQTGDKLKLITENIGDVFVMVTEVSGTNITIEYQNCQALGKQVFVYGKEVDDFHTVDYDAISMLNVSATQEQQKLIEALQQQNAALKAELEQKTSELDARLEQLELFMSTAQR